MAYTFVSSIIFLLATFAAGGANTATFTVKNNCNFTVLPAVIPVGGGAELGPGQTWTVDVPIGTSGRFWGRTGCSFNGSGSSGRCDTGNCAGALNCTVSGQTPTTEAEFTIGGGSTGIPSDFYDMSVIDGYNLPMAFSCSTGVGLVCTSPTCPDACLFASDDCRTHACSSNSNYQVTFCP